MLWKDFVALVVSYDAEHPEWAERKVIVEGFDDIADVGTVISEVANSAVILERPSR